MNKYIDKFVLLPMSQIGMLALGIGVFYFFSYFDRGELIDAEIAAAVKSIAEEQNQKKETEELIREEENIRKRAAQLSEDIKEFDRKIPVTLRHSEVINYITSLCKDLGCTIAKNPEKKEDADDKLPYFEKVKLDIKIEGRFPVLMKLMFILVTGDKLYLIDNLKLTRVESQKSDSKVMLEGLLIAFKQIAKEEAK